LQFTSLSQELELGKEIDCRDEEVVSDLLKEQLETIPEEEQPNVDMTYRSSRSSKTKWMFSSSGENSL